LGNIVGGAVLVGFTYYVAYKYSPSKSKDNSCDVKAY
jgi:Formate/nitrite family of transporters